MHGELFTKLYCTSTVVHPVQNEHWNNKWSWSSLFTWPVSSDGLERGANNAKVMGSSPILASCLEQMKYLSTKASFNYTKCQKHCSLGETSSILLTSKCSMCLFSHYYCQYPTQLVNNKKLAWSTKGLDALRVGIKNDHHTLRFVLVLVNSWCCVLSLCVLHMQNFRFNLRNYTVDLCANWVTFNHEGTRTLNLLIRSQTPCPLGHVVLLLSPEV